jgi:hypothetical protein
VIRQVSPALLATLAAVWLLSCAREDWQVIDLAPGATVEDALAIDLYRPMLRAKLLDDPEAAYGPPKSNGRAGRASHFKEYVSEIGRIRVLDETWTASEEHGGGHQRWLEVFPGKVYVQDLLLP